MADVKINYLSEGADKIKQDFKTVQNGVKKINESPVKVTMSSKGIQETIDAFGRLKIEIPKLEQQYKNLQDKNSAVAKQMEKDLKNLIRVVNDFNSALAGGNVSKNVLGNSNNSGALEATLMKEKLITEELERQEKIRQSQEKELDALRIKLQGISRTLSDQQNALATGKKGKTPMDIAHLLEQLEEGKIRAEELASALGEGNEVVQHFRNGMDWTERNNPLRAMRDEAYKLIPDIKKLTVEIEKIKASGKDYNLLGLDEEQLQEKMGRLQEIFETFQAVIDEMGDNPRFAQYKDDMQQTVDLLQQQLEKEAGVALQRQQKINLDETQNQKEKEYLSLLKEKFQLENKVLQLNKDKDSAKANKNQTQEYQQQIAAINKKLLLIKNGIKFTDDAKQKIRQLTKEHENERKVIVAKNKDIEDSNGLLSDTLKNFMKFTLYYAGINALKQGVQQALETMKELDKAFTDIQIVTGDTDEQTAKLAQEYNALAKEMGSTTTEVAEGAGEWFNESRDHLKLFELLETRKD